jgi:hypothetical protein
LPGAYSLVPWVKFLRGVLLPRLLFLPLILRSGLGYPSGMGPLAGTALATTSNATGSGGGHGGMGSLGCGVYRWDSNYNTCACLHPPVISRHPPLAAASDAWFSLPQLRIACVEWSWRVRQWGGRWGGSGWPGRRCRVPSGQLHSHFPFVLLCCCSTRTPVLPPQPLTLEPPPPSFHQVLQTLLVYGKVSSNGESSRCAKTQSGTSLSSGKWHARPIGRRARARDISQAAVALAAPSPSSQDLCWAAGALRPTVSTFGQFISPQLTCRLLQAATQSLAAPAPPRLSLAALVAGGAFYCVTAQPPLLTQSSAPSAAAACA